MSLLENITSGLFPATTAIGIALLVRGHHDAGDGFSGGLLAALGASALLFGHGRQKVAARVGLRRAWIFPLAGFALVLASVFAPLVLGLPPLSHWPPAGAPDFAVLGFSFHTALLFDAGVFLIVYGAVLAGLELFSEVREER